MISEHNPRVTLSRWVQSIFYLDDKPFCLDRRGYLIPIYDSGYEELLLMTGRQVEKSTTLTTVSLGLGTAIPNFKVLYGVPDDAKRRQWSHDKLSPLINRSPVVKERFMRGPDILDNVYEKKLSNGSQIYLRNDGADGDNFRGQSIDLLLLDEVQDLLATAVVVAEEALSHSEKPGLPVGGIKMFTGTPKTIENHIEGAWRESTQTEFLVKCWHCSGGDLSYYNNLGIPNINPDLGLICAKCGRKISVTDGLWVDSYPNRFLKGYRISQLMVPWTNFKKLYWRKLLRYPEAQFMNEVLGISWDSASKFFTEGELRELCEASNHRLVSGPVPNSVASSVTLAGIDWGVNSENGAYTVLTIGQVVAPEILKVIYAKKFDHRMGMTDQMKFIIDKLKEFRVELVAADWGASGDRNVLISEALGPNKIVQVRYSGSGLVSESYENKMATLSINRTMALSDFKTDMVERNMYRLPCWEDFEPIAEHILNEFIDTRTNGDMFYTHARNAHDDGLMSMVYLGIARKIRFGFPLLNTITSVN